VFWLLVFWPKKNSVTGTWRTFYGEELHDLYSVRIIMSVIKSTRKGYRENVACVGMTGNIYTGLVGIPEGKEITWKL